MNSDTLSVWNENLQYHLKCVRIMHSMQNLTTKSLCVVCRVTIMNDSSELDLKSACIMQFITCNKIIRTNNMLRSNSARKESFLQMVGLVSGRSLHVYVERLGYKYWNRHYLTFSVESSHCKNGIID